MSKLVVDVTKGTSEVVSLTEKEVQELQAWDDDKPSRDMESLREARDRLLAETDWWAGSDLTMTQAQTDYRQALRDITDNATSLDDVIWPEKP